MKSASSLHRLLSPLSPTTRENRMSMCRTPKIQYMISQHLTFNIQHSAQHNQIQQMPSEKHSTNRSAEWLSIYIYIFICAALQSVLLKINAKHLHRNSRQTCCLYVLYYSRCPLPPSPSPAPRCSASSIRLVLIFVFVFVFSVFWVLGKSTVHFENSALKSESSSHLAHFGRFVVVLRAPKPFPNSWKSVKFGVFWIIHFHFGWNNFTNERIWTEFDSDVWMVDAIKSCLTQL